jgi:cyclopropane fatty-acyl-phospholipid synthase-like methyltransferase
MRRVFFELSYLLGRPPWDSGISPPELLAYLDAHSPARGLDLGCGTGTNVLTMAQRGLQVAGIDFSFVAILRARQRLQRAGLRADLHHGDVSRMEPIAGTFDLALDIGCFHALGDEQKLRYASQLARRVMPGGAFLLYSFIDSGVQEGRSWPSRDEICSIFDESFQVKSVVEGRDRERRSAWFTLQRRP